MPSKTAPVIDIDITLQPKQKTAFDRSFTTPVLFYGGAKGGGKSYLVRARQVFRRLKFSNTHGVIIRKTYPELLANHINMMWMEYPQLKKYYNKSEKMIYFPNGSTLSFSYLKSLDDVWTYQGRAYEDIDVDEITQHEEMTFKILRSSNRTANTEFQKAGGIPTMLLTGNPGGIGHGWCKRLFVDEQYRDTENPQDFDFVQAFLKDNKKLMEADPKYIKQLEDLPEHLRRAYLEGDWSIHAGQAFYEISREKHLIDPFELTNVRYFAGYDHGFNHPFSFVLFAVNNDGIVYVIDYVKARLKRPDEIARELIAKLKGKRVEIHAGPDIWSRQRDGGPTVFEQLTNSGLRAGSGFPIIKGHDDRPQGVAEIRKYLAWNNTKTNEPRLFFFRNCLEVFNNVSEMQFNPDKPEDVLKIDADSEGNGGDDLYDAFRYGLMSRAFKPKTPEDAPDKGTPAWILQEHLKSKDLQRRTTLWS